MGRHKHFFLGANQVSHITCSSCWPSVISIVLRAARFSDAVQNGRWKNYVILLPGWLQPVMLVSDFRPSSLRTSCPMVSHQQACGLWRSVVKIFGFSSAVWSSWRPNHCNEAVRSLQVQFRMPDDGRIGPISSLDFTASLFIQFSAPGSWQNLHCLQSFTLTIFTNTTLNNPRLFTTPPGMEGYASAVKNIDCEFYQRLSHNSISRVSLSFGLNFVTCWRLGRSCAVLKKRIKIPAMKILKNDRLYL